MWLYISSINLNTFAARTLNFCKALKRTAMNSTNTLTELLHVFTTDLPRAFAFACFPFLFISKDTQTHPTFFSLHIGFIRHSQPAGESLPCFFFKTDFFVAYGAERAVHCTPDLLCFLKL